MNKGTTNGKDRVKDCGLRDWRAPTQLRARSAIAPERCPLLRGSQPRYSAPSSSSDAAALCPDSTTSTRAPLETLPAWPVSALVQDDSLHKHGTRQVTPTPTETASSAGAPKIVNSDMCTRRVGWAKHEAWRRERGATCVARPGLLLGSPAASEVRGSSLIGRDREAAPERAG